VPAVPGQDPQPIHLKPAAELAERVLLPGDPHRALAVAQALLDKPRMFNHHRGLWGYTGTAADGKPVTIQSTGMGGPSAAIVVTELLELGARRLIRIGTCGALANGLALGDLLTVTEALADDGASRALGAGERVRADAALTEALAEAAGGARGPVVSTDLFYDDRPGLADGWIAAGALAVEMEAATVLRLCEARGAAGGCVLAVSDLLEPERVRIGRDDLEAAGVRLGEAALAAFSN
jgi:DeoD family purine-nucleoside phosphorylase